MLYSSELSFFLRLIEEFRFPYNIIDRECPEFSNLDGGIRKLLDSDYDEKKAIAQIFKHIKSNTIYKLTDEFLCCYVFFRLPDSQKEKLIMIGPYTQREISYEKLLKQTKSRKINPEWLPSLERYFSSVNYIADDHILFTPLQVLGEKMWGKDSFIRDNFDIKAVKNSDSVYSAFFESPKSHDDFNLSIVEKRYQSENKLMEAVKQGKAHQVQAMLSLFTPANIEHRAAEPIRNAKNYLIILNTLMRKAVEQSGVHPIHIDRLSSNFAKKIENITSWVQISSLCKNMAAEYCKLTKKQNLKGYSSAIQKVIAIIDFDLTANLTLSALAEQVNVNAAYLSSQFKKQTGTPLTDYINICRIDRAKLLLKSTNMSIGETAQCCGIADSNYFTKLFKKYTGETPKEFRNS